MENRMSENIIQFPEDRCVQRNLNGVKTILEDLYDSMKLCYSTIETIEEKIKETELEYDKIFTQYVKARGIDNVEIEYLQYVSGDIKINLETGEVSYESFEKTEEPEPSGET